MLPRTPSPRLSSPLCSSLPGALLLLSGLGNCPTNTLQLIQHKAGCHGPAVPPVSEGTRSVSIHALGSWNWVIAKEHQTAHQNGPGYFQQKITMGNITNQLVTTWQHTEGFPLLSLAVV